MLEIIEETGFKYVTIEHLHSSKAYGRSASIILCVDKCDVCGVVKPVIATDSSDAEYGDVCVCQDCAIAAFEQFHREYQE